MLALSVGLHAAVWLLWPREGREPPKKPSDLVTVELRDRTRGETPGDKPAPPNGPVTKRQRPPKAPRRPAPAPVPEPESAAPVSPGQVADNDAPEPGPVAPGPAPVRDPSSVNLFDPNALGSSLSRWQRSQRVLDPRAGRGSGGGGDPDGAEAEHKRVSGRLNGFLAGAQAAASREAGLADSCDNGIDDEFDGYLDCSAPGCFAAPVCQGTRLYEDAVAARIPDEGSFSRALRVAQGGRIRKLTARVRISHEAMRQLHVSIVSPSGRRAVLHVPNDGDDSFTTVFYVRELIGEDAPGEWSLQIRDTVGGVEGRFVSWELYVTS